MSYHSYKCSNPQCGFPATKFYKIGSVVPQSIPCECGWDMMKTFKPIHVIYKGNGFTKQVGKEDEK